jgi:heat shock protein HtpX
MSPETFARHRRQNRRQTWLLVGGMAIVLALTGWLLGGRSGLLAALVVSGVAAAWAPQASSKLLLRMYRARPLPESAAPQIARAFAALSGRGGLEPPPTLYYVPSQMPNAFAVGSGAQAAVAVTDGLLRMLTLRELTGVLAHELSHIRHQDTRVMAVADVFSRMTSSLSQMGQFLLLLSLPALFAGRAPLSTAGLLALVFAPAASVLLQMALSRAREFDADAGAAELTGDPEALAAALIKLERWQLGPWWKRVLLPVPTTKQPAMLRSHPHTEERVARLRGLRGGEFAQLPAESPIPAGLEVLHLPPVGTRPRWRLNGAWY